MCQVPTTPSAENSFPSDGSFGSAIKLDIPSGWKTDGSLASPIRPESLFGVEVHLNLERLCSSLRPEEIGLSGPRSNVDVRGPRGTVVTHLCDDVSRPDGVSLFYLNLPDVSVGVGDAVLLIFEDYESRLSVPIYISSLLVPSGRVTRTTLPSNGASTSCLHPYQSPFSFPALPGL